MSTIVTRVGKGSPLTWTEVDSNFTNLNTDKLQSGNTASSLTITSATINGGTITGITDLAVADGGTGLSTLTAGYIPFGAGTSAFGSSANLFWDSANNNLGIGTNSLPTGPKLTVKGTAVSAGYDGIRVLGNGANANTSIYEAYGSRPDANALSSFSGGILLSRINTAPAALTTGMGVGRVAFGGSYDGTTTNIVYGAQVIGVTEGTYSSTSAPTAIAFKTTASGTAGYPASVNTEVGTERMRIDSAGNVGIGTASPGAKLDVSVSGLLAIKSTASTGTSGIYNQFTNTGGSFYIGIDSSTASTFAAGNYAATIQNTTSGNMVIDQFTSNSIILKTANTERMRIDSSGNVGIGTTGPGAKLEVYGNAAAPSTTANNGVFRINTGTSNEIQIGTYSTSPFGVWMQTKQNTNSGSTYSIILNPLGGGVGIGTASPSETLQVNGSNVVVASEVFGFSVSGVTDATKALRMGYDNTNDVAVISASDIGTGWKNIVISPPGSLSNVGIGTNSPANVLQVAKNQTADTAIVVSNAGTSNAATTMSFVLAESTTPQGWFRRYRDGTGITEIGYSDILTFSGNVTSTKAERMRITSGGEVYIAGTADQGAYNLQCNGTGVWGAGAYVNGSDARIKENIVSIDSGLDVVNKLNPVTYTYKEDWSKDQSTQTGFIAQELLVALEGKNYVDGIVQQGGEYMSVAYQNIIPLLTKAIQELSAKVETLEAQLQGK
jgi:hypothetical protein